jgi:transcriptional regulator
VALRRVLTGLLIVAILVFAGLDFLRYRDKSVASAAAEFMPRTAVRVSVPAGTQIEAVLKNLFSTSTKPGDAMLAFVEEPVVIHGSTAIPAGARLDGIVEQITKIGSEGVVRLRFNSLATGRNSFHIKTDPVLTNAPIESDFSILSNAAGALTGAGIGVAMGAAGRSEGTISAGLAAGAMRGAAAVDEGNIKITVVLAQPISLIR